jgi:hypothetical protein
VGQTTVGGSYDFALASFNSNGTLDTSFGTSGKVTTNFAGANDLPFSVAVQLDGNIVVAGGATVNGFADFAVARYIGNAVLPTPDIDTAPASLAFGNVTQGTFKDLAVTVRNTGNATLNVTSTTLLGTAEYSIVAGGGAFSLAPAATRQVTVRLTPTSLGSKVATLSFASNDTDENAKIVPVSGTAVASSDLVVSALTGPATAGAGSAITLNETTGNIGVGPTGGTSTRYYLSSDTSIGAGDVLLGGRSLAGLAPGASSSGATNVTIPAGTANGSYFIIARADDLNQAFESNEGNNTRAATIAVVVASALKIQSESATTSSGNINILPTQDIDGGNKLVASVVGQTYDYSVNIPTAGNYMLAVRICNFPSASGASTVHFQNTSGANISGPLTLLNGTQWTTVAAASGVVVNLPAGTQRIRMVVDSLASAGTQLNWFAITPVGR